MRLLQRALWFQSIFILCISVLFLSACGGGSGGSNAGITPVSVTPETIINNPTGPIPPGAPTSSDLERSFAIAAGIIARQQANGAWQFDNEGKLITLTDAYQGQAGILFFLCRLYQSQPHPEVKKSIQAGATWLKNQKMDNDGPGLYSGLAGVAYAYLSLYESLKEPEWLDAAISIAKRIENDQTQLTSAPADMITGHVGSGLFFLKLYAISQDQRWLNVARIKADESLTKATPSGGGIKFESTLGGNEKLTYVGFAHGAAGAGYFYASLSQSLGTSDEKYKKAAQDIATWLRSVITQDGTGINWYRREPDQKSILQNQWCHGAPGIGLFFTKLYEITQNPQDLVMSKEAAATVVRLGHTGTSLCHGTTGNAQLFLRLFRLTGDTSYLQTARTIAEKLWLSWDRSLHYPSWMGDDGSIRIHNASLMTGNAGRGYFYLQLSDPQKIAMPFLE